MRQYTVKYAFVGFGGAIVHRGTQIISLHSASESEALAAIKRWLNGSWRSYGDVDVIITEIRPFI